MRNDIVLRPLPCHFYDVERMESWLQEQAAKGLFLTRWGIVFARFRRAEPAKVRYRITAARLEGNLSTFAATLPRPSWTPTPPYRR